MLTFHSSNEMRLQVVATGGTYPLCTLVLFNTALKHAVTIRRIKG